jgi:hypothetical protein
MRKYLIYVFVTLTVLSCTKESVTPPQQQQPQEQQPQEQQPQVANRLIPSLYISCYTTPELFLIH